ncbi:MAG: hypothetical protein K0Q59_3214 [Paenibacillus sp.]|jgi:hypothetical protein|nr:hypothetical protein [Paenibacillus sp.]
MVPNSLYVKDELREKNNRPLTKQRRDPHRTVRLDPRRKAEAGEIALTGPWQVAADLYMPGMREAVDDLEHFLRLLGVELDSDSPRRIVLKLDDRIDHQAFRLEAQENGIDIRAKNMQGIWSGLVNLEKEMAIRNAAIVPVGVIERKPAWGVQISQAPYGASFLVPHLSSEYLSDDSFRLLAHYGVNGMQIYGDMLCYVKSELFPELNHPDCDYHLLMLRDAAMRAKKFGIQLYWVPIGPKLRENHPLFLRRPDVRGAKVTGKAPGSDLPLYSLCSSHPDVLQFHGEMMADLVTEAPDLGGLILIIGGEAYKHCLMRADRTGLQPGEKTNCPTCRGIHPETVVTKFVAATSDAVRRANPQTEVMVWEYSAHHWTSDEDQLELIERLPAGTSLLTTLDKGQVLQKAGYKKDIWDYSVEYAGPCDRVLLQTEVAKRRGLPYVLKLETAIGLECVNIPYMPSLANTFKKWKNAAALEPKGVFQSWCFFGMWGSRAEEIGWWASWRPELDDEQVLDHIAARDFGPYAALMKNVWEKIGESASHLPYIGSYYRGPEFLGPGHPLFFADPAPSELPEVFQGSIYMQELYETYSRDMIDERKPLLRNGLECRMETDDGSDKAIVAIAEYEQAVRLAQEAVDLLQAAEEAEDPMIRANMREERQLVEAIWRIFASTLHTWQFLYHKQRYKTDPHNGSLQRMKEIAALELANAREARPLYAEVPWLDVSDRTEGGGFPSSLAMIDCKIALMERELESNG